MSEGSGLVRWHILFSGRVQGVGFRYTSKYLAERLYLTGWVDNLWDGRVEMEAQGSLTQLRKLIIELKDQRYIRITDMDVEEIDVLPYERHFEIRGY